MKDRKDRKIEKKGTTGSGDKHRKERKIEKKGTTGSGDER